MTKVSDVLTELPAVSLVRDPCPVLMTVSFLVSLNGGGATRMPSTNWSWAADTDVQMISVKTGANSASECGRNLSAARADVRDIRSWCDAIAAGR